MKLYNKRSNVDIMVVGTTLGFLISTPLVRYITIPVMPWKQAIMMCGLMWAFTTPIFALLGRMTDSLNLRTRYGYNHTRAELNYLDELDVEVEEQIANGNPKVN